MKNRFWACFFAFGLSLNFAVCQKVDTDYSAPKLPPLDSLVQKAIRNAPRLKMQDAWLAALESERKIRKFDWSDNISLNAGVLYGTTDIASYTSAQSIDYQLNTLRSDLNYNIGVGIRFPLADLLKRPEQLRLQQLLIERAMAERGIIEQELRLLITREYDGYQGANQNMATRAEELGGYRMALEVSDQYFRAGQLPTAEYSQILARKVNAEEEFNKAKSQSAAHLHQLQILVGY